jgi:hypothetical protein
MYVARLTAILKTEEVKSKITSRGISLRQVVRKVKSE